MDPFKRPAAVQPSSTSSRFFKPPVHQCGDVFPSDDVIDSTDRLTALDGLNIDAIAQTIVPFTSFLVKTRHFSEICYKILDLNSNLIAHFYYMIRSLAKPGAECRRISREKLEKRLSKPFVVSNKKNADVRLGYRWKKNVFFVKYLFTFGVRQTEKDEIHLLETAETPLWYFQSRMENDGGSRLKSLDFLNFSKFSEHKLLPKKMYAIKGNVRYAILTVQKTKFSIHRCTPRLLEAVEEWYDPRMECTYSIPPPTPSLDMDAKWNDDEPLKLGTFDDAEIEDYYWTSPVDLQLRQQLQAIEEATNDDDDEQLPTKGDLARIENHGTCTNDDDEQLQTKGDLATSPVTTNDFMMDLEAIQLDESLYDSKQLDALFAELVPKDIYL